MLYIHVRYSIFITKVFKLTPFDCSQTAIIPNHIIPNKRFQITDKKGGYGLAIVAGSGCYDYRGHVSIAAMNNLISNVVFPYKQGCFGRMLTITDLFRLPVSDDLVHNKNDRNWSMLLLYLIVKSNAPNITSCLRSWRSGYR